MADTCVIFNPHSGRGRAEIRMSALRRQLADRAVFWPTTHPGHGEELAKKAATAQFRVVAAAGGDGTVHEVVNGLLAAACPEVAFAVFPIGSANDYAYSLGIANESDSQPVERYVDVGVVSDGTGRQRFFVCCLGIGFNGMVTLEARKIKWLQGIPLYGLATVRALWNHHSCPPIAMAIDEHPPKTWATLMLSVLVGRREGGFVMAPEAKLDDGLFDFVQAGDLSRWEVLKLLPRLAIAGPPRDNPKVRLGQCQRITLHSPTSLVVHADGEFFAQPENGVRSLTIQLLPKALRIHRLYSELDTNSR
jgi:diacylglycerol kinase family enzyme